MQDALHRVQVSRAHDVAAQRKHAATDADSTLLFDENGQPASSKPKKKKTSKKSRASQQTSESSAAPNNESAVSSASRGSRRSRSRRQSASKSNRQSDSRSRRCFCSRRQNCLSDFVAFRFFLFFFCYESLTLLRAACNARSTPFVGHLQFNINVIVFTQQQRI